MWEMGVGVCGLDLSGSVGEMGMFIGTVGRYGDVWKMDMNEWRG